MAVCGVHSILCRLLRRWTWLNPVDDHRRTLLPGSAASRHVGGGPDQLVRQLCGRDWLPYYAGEHPC